MRRFHLLLILTLCLSRESFAQLTFQKTYGDVQFDDAQSIVQTTDGGYCLAGNTASALPNAGDMVLYRLNADGDLLWSVRIGGPKDDFVSDLLLLPDGGYLLTGITYGSPADTVYSDIFAVRLNAQGSVQWARAYGGMDYDEVAAACLSENGGFVLAGNTSSFGTSLKSAAVLLLDSLGHTIGGTLVSTTISNFFLDVESLPATSGGGFIAGGGTFNLNGGTNFDHYVTSFNSDGSVRWIRRFGSPSADWTYALKPTPNGGLMACGVSTGPGAGGVDQSVYRLDGSGNLVWSSHYGAAESDRATDLVMDATSGHTFVCGFTNIGDSVQPIQQATLLGIDSSGNRLFDYRYGDSGATSEAYRILGLNDGFALCGYTLGFTDTLGDAYVVRTDMMGASNCYEAPVNFTTTSAVYSDSIGGSSQTLNMSEWNLPWSASSFVNQFFRICTNSGMEAIPLSDIRLFPNPATEAVWIRGAGRKPLEWKLFDGLGNLISTGVRRSEDDAITLSGIEPGVYFLQWHCDDSSGVMPVVHN